jgi:hypothetical protein
MSSLRFRMNWRRGRYGWRRIQQEVEQALPRELLSSAQIAELRM